ncbi:X-ray repair cross-complementing protein 6 [Geodia barretti]|uniref:X-ray repair cross-complementing protein 6 n=1 Tax=Geodia barretti TaxID=519541 RepID=A0AA35RW87_GEOBA|nr:X-ray repair cross-complementing protein 6 [Geodia barretti]
MTSATGWSWGSAWGDDALDDQEDEAGGRVYASSKDCLVLLLDAGKQMFQGGGQPEDVPFALCLKCVKSVLLNKIISSEKDLVGVVLYGTAKSQNKSDFKHVYVLQDLDTPDAPRIKEIEDMLSAQSLQNLSASFGHSDDYSMSDVLWTCSNMLSDSVSKNSHKRIILFTNQR